MRVIERFVLQTNGVLSELHRIGGDVPDRLGSELCDVVYGRELVLLFTIQCLRCSVSIHNPRGSVRPSNELNPLNPRITSAIDDWKSPDPYCLDTVIVNWFLLHR